VSSQDDEFPSALLFFSRRQVWYRRITRAFSSRRAVGVSRTPARYTLQVRTRTRILLLVSRKRALPSVDKRSQIGKRAISTRNPTECREIISTLRYSLFLSLPPLSLSLFSPFSPHLSFSLYLIPLLSSNLFLITGVKCNPINTADCRYIALIKFRNCCDYKDRIKVELSKNRMSNVRVKISIIPINFE